MIDWALSDLDPHIGYPLGDDLILNNLAYADDVLLLSSTPAGLQQQLDNFSSNLLKGGA